MKKLLTVLLVLGSFSSFADCKCVKDGNVTYISMDVIVDGVVVEEKRGLTYYSSEDKDGILITASERCLEALEVTKSTGLFCN